MRLVLSIILTFFGLMAIYLFASGALSGTEAGVENAVERALRPFSQADILSTVVLTLGMALFAIGILISPRADVWIAFSSNKNQPVVESQVMHYTREVSREKILEIALFFNVLVVGALLVLLCMTMNQESSSEMIGAIFLTGLVEAAIGTMILVYSFLRRRHVTQKKFRPLLAASAGLNIVEVIFMVGILLCGVV